MRFVSFLCICLVVHPINTIDKLDHYTSFHQLWYRFNPRTVSQCHSHLRARLLASPFSTTCTRTHKTTATTIHYGTDTYQAQKKSRPSRSCRHRWTSSHRPTDSCGRCTRSLATSKGSRRCTSSASLLSAWSKSPRRIDVSCTCACFLHSSHTSPFHTQIVC